MGLISVYESDQSGVTTRQDSIAFNKILEFGIAGNSELMMSKFKHYLIVEETGTITWNKKYLRKLSNIHLHDLLKRLEEL